jgi:hypothetical protein
MVFPEVVNALFEAIQAHRILFFPAVATAFRERWLVSITCPE